MTFERKVATQLLAHILTGTSFAEIGIGYHVMSLGFQQGPKYPADDLVVELVSQNDTEPSLTMALAVRRTPNFVPSDIQTSNLIQNFIKTAQIAQASKFRLQLGLVVAGPQNQARQLAELSNIAQTQKDESSFFDLLHTDQKFRREIRTRLDHIEQIVATALSSLGETTVDSTQTRRRTWEMLSILTVLMPRLESPDDQDWTAITNSLIPVARESNSQEANLLRDRLFVLASQYSPQAATVDLNILRRDTHQLLKPLIEKHQQGWQVLDHLESRALYSVRNKIETIDLRRKLTLDRDKAIEDLVNTIKNEKLVVVSGESGTGKSSLVLLGVSSATDKCHDFQMSSLNLRHISDPLEFEAQLGTKVSTLLSELSAPHRVLIIDGAEAAIEGKADELRYLVNAAKLSDLNLVVITSTESKKAITEILSEADFANPITHYCVPLLSNQDIDYVIQNFPELKPLVRKPESHNLLRRLVVVDLLIRSGINGVPLSEVEAMKQIWSGLIGRHGHRDHGAPNSRQSILLELAKCELFGINKFDVWKEADQNAIFGLQQDGILKQWRNGALELEPEFSHDEIRHYALAYWLVLDQNPVRQLMLASAPRWAVTAARLACQYLLEMSDEQRQSRIGLLIDLRSSFQSMVDRGCSSRWGDIPFEALLVIANPLPLVRQVWQSLVEGEEIELQNIVRIASQRHRAVNGTVNISTVEPIINMLLTDQTPWRTWTFTQDLIRRWLRAHVNRRTQSGNELRIKLRNLIVAAISKAGLDPQKEKISNAIPREATDRFVLEMLALLGPDLGSEGEQILIYVAQQTPDHLAPTVEELFVAESLASYNIRLLAQLTQSYYIDNTSSLNPSIFDDGIRDHKHLGFPMGTNAAYWRGPFMILLHMDFELGVRTINNIINHATHIRISSGPDSDLYGNPRRSDYTLAISGDCREFYGDEQVWCWYRGTGVGPYPCLSALQALELACDRQKNFGTPLSTIVSTLLNTCQSLATVAVTVGFLIRHLVETELLMEPYLIEPAIWDFETTRCTYELSRRDFAAPSDGIFAPSRRSWSLIEATMCIVLNADDNRANELRGLGVKLSANQTEFYLTETRDQQIQKPDLDIESNLTHGQLVRINLFDKGKYNVTETPNGMAIEIESPDITRQKAIDEDLNRWSTASQIHTRYLDILTNHDKDVIDTNRLIEDIDTIQKILETPSQFQVPDPLDTATLVAAVALRAYLHESLNIPDKNIAFVTEILYRVAESRISSSSHSYEGTLNESNAWRSAARIFPLLLSPTAAHIRLKYPGLRKSHMMALRRFVFGQNVVDRYRTIQACFNLAVFSEFEVRLYFARGLDFLWASPCTVGRNCHHRVGLQLAVATAHGFLVSRRMSDSWILRFVAVVPGSSWLFALLDSKAVVVSRLDAAIRSLGSAAVSNICVSNQAKQLLLAILDLQQRSLLSVPSHRLGRCESHILVSARAMLSLSRRDIKQVVLRYVETFVDNSILLHTTLRALSAAAEESQDRAIAAMRLWPDIVECVLASKDWKVKAIDGEHFDRSAFAALLPNQAPDWSYVYRESSSSADNWWDPNSMQPTVEKWLEPAAGSPNCVDQLIGFLSVLEIDEQCRLGLPWIAKLVLADPSRIVRSTLRLNRWLIQIQPANDDHLRLVWQEVIDALVVAGDSQLVSFSE